jgi:hypothetical protein
MFIDLHGYQFYYLRHRVKHKMLALKSHYQKNIPSTGEWLTLGLC